MILENFVLIVIRISQFTELYYDIHAALETLPFRISCVNLSTKLRYILVFVHRSKTVKFPLLVAETQDKLPLQREKNFALVTAASF